MVWCRVGILFVIRIMITNSIYLNSLDGALIHCREWTAQMTLLALDREVPFQEGRLGGHIGGECLTTGPAFLARIRHHCQLPGHLLAFADKQGQLGLGAVGLVTLGEGDVV